MPPFVGSTGKIAMADVRKRVSGNADVDERGRFRNKDADDGSGRSTNLKKKKKKKVVEKEPLVIEDNTYKVGQEKKKKKRSVTIEGTAKLIKTAKEKGKEVAAVKPAGATALKKRVKGKAATLQAVEVYAELPPIVDEYDAETRRIFENLISLATRFEEQMEDRIYNKDVYALNVVYSQIREVIADLRATRDISAQIAELENMVMRPYQLVVAQCMHHMYFHMDGAISKFVKDADTRNEILKKLKTTMSENAETLQSEYMLTLDRARKVLI